MLQNFNEELDQLVDLAQIKQKIQALQGPSSSRLGLEVHKHRPKQIQQSGQKNHLSKARVELVHLPPTKFQTNNTLQRSKKSGRCSWQQQVIANNVDHQRECHPDQEVWVTTGKSVGRLAMTTQQGSTIEIPVPPDRGKGIAMKVEIITLTGL